MGRLATTLSVSLRESFASATNVLHHRSAVSPSQTLESIVCPAFSSSPQHSAIHTLLAGRPSFGGQRTSLASRLPRSAPRELFILSLSFTEVFSGNCNGICLPSLSQNSCCPPISAVKSKIQLKLTYEALTGRRSNQVSLNVAVNTRLTGRSNGHFAAGRVWGIKS